MVKTQRGGHEKKANLFLATSKETKSLRFLLPLRTKDARTFLALLLGTVGNEQGPFVSGGGGGKLFGLEALILKEGEEGKRLFLFRDESGAEKRREEERATSGLSASLSVSLSL